MKKYKAKFVPLNSHPFLNWCGKRCLSFWERKGTGEKEKWFIYTISGEVDEEGELQKRVLEAEKEGREIEVEYVRKFRQKFVNDVK